MTAPRRPGIWLPPTEQTVWRPFGGDAQVERPDIGISVLPVRHSGWNGRIAGQQFRSGNALRPRSRRNNHGAEVVHKGSACGY